MATASAQNHIDGNLKQCPQNVYERFYHIQHNILLSYSRCAFFSFIALCFVQLIYLYCFKKYRFKKGSRNKVKRKNFFYRFFIEAPRRVNSGKYLWSGKDDTPILPILRDHFKHTFREGISPTGKPVLDLAWKTLSMGESTSDAKKLLLGRVATCTRILNHRQ